MQTIYLDISNKGVIPTIHAKQGDVGRKFQVVLTDSGLPYIPVGGSAFSVWYSGASGEGNYTEVGDKSAFSVSGNKVTVEMISQMLSNDGEGILSLALNDPNGNQISTWNIPYVCEYVPGAGSQEAKAYYTAFSQAVENLPYPDASLSVSGKAADAAATGKALAGKAPAGYGLGEHATSYYVASETELNAVLTNMLSKLPDRSVGFFICDDTTGVLWTGGAMHVTVYKRDTQYSCARFYSYGADGAVSLQKSLYNHVWSPLEWVNPTMVLGVEYRTTERRDGKGVYATAYSIGGLAGKGSYGGYSPYSGKVFECHGLYVGSDGKYNSGIEQDGRVSLYVTADNYIQCRNNVDWDTHSNVIVTLKYTKD